MELLKEDVRTVERILRPATKRINWSALSVGDFCTKCNSAIGVFESLVHQVSGTEWKLKTSIDYFNLQYNIYYNKHNICYITVWFHFRCRRTRETWSARSPV